jgi:16S rRNA A1518/A1519 N6-dimethyltransferase RsmA/KsgA/DIM1 with predicted DNA glycosylase/AP lyase activity
VIILLFLTRNLDKIIRVYRMEKVKPKKHLGQHFLTDLGIAENIAKAITGHGGVTKVLEIGPGMGVLTDFLLMEKWDLYLVDIDKESIKYLREKYPDLGEKIIEADFLRKDFAAIMQEPYAIIGNFPYNISSQILFTCIGPKKSGDRSGLYAAKGSGTAYSLSKREQGLWYPVGVVTGIL